jgi:hypothetical protein
MGHRGPATIAALGPAKRLLQPRRRAGIAPPWSIRMTWHIGPFGGGGPGRFSRPSGSFGNPPAGTFLTPPVPATPPLGQTPAPPPSAAALQPQGKPQLAERAGMSSRPQTEAPSESEDHVLRALPPGKIHKWDAIARRAGLRQNSRTRGLLKAMTDKGLLTHHRGQGYERGPAAPPWHEPQPAADVTLRVT